MDQVGRGRMGNVFPLVIDQSFQVETGEGQILFWNDGKNTNWYEVMNGIPQTERTEYSKARIGIRLVRMYFQMVKRLLTKNRMRVDMEWWMKSPLGLVVNWRWNCDSQ